MDVSVILCTFNRCRSLGKALASVAASQMADSVSWEVLVIDNNSSDRTCEVVEEFSQQYPRKFRYLFESQQGKSQALNRGIREAEADLLVFMDDDVEVDSKWLNRLEKAMQDKRWSGCGGRILPDSGFVPPRWVETERPYALAPLALFDLGSEAGELKEPPFGTNMAFRKEMFSKYGGFRIDLGPQPGSQIRSEDTEFGARLLSGGEPLWYEPSAVVYHPVTAERLQKKYFLAWWYDKARAEIREDGPPNNSKWIMAGIPSCLFRRLIGWSIRWICALDPGRRFSNKLNVWRVAGAMEECYRQREDGWSSTAQATLRRTSRPEMPPQKET